MMKKYLFFCVFTLPLFLHAQMLFEREKRDNIWLFGGKKIRLDFSSDSVKILDDNRLFPMDVANASICDAAGNLLFYTNCLSIANFEDDTIENGGRINPGSYSDEWFNYGLPHPQGALILPFPNHGNLYYLFYEELFRAPEISAYATRVYSLAYALIDMQSNNGTGKVLKKDIPIIQDTLDYGKIVATRHANGRDWWIVVPEFDSDKYYELLLTPDGILNYGKLSTDSNHFDGLGQSQFTPNGSKYIQYNLYRYYENYLSISDFDRGTGEMSNTTTLLDTLLAGSGGIAISENSRFLYAPTYSKIYQYDLEAEDVEASKVTVAEYDGYYDENPFLKTNFFLAALAPDNKIYISANNGCKYLHVIHNPNKKGLACHVEQHGIKLPAYNIFTMPNYPYYGLGPLDGSPADTLGIDNPPPIADFEYVQDGTRDYEVNFYNATRFSPEATMYIVPEDAYSWTFGDWESSHEKHPVHSYKAAGTYRVCLTATNLAGSDTHCDTVIVTQDEADASVSPLHNTKLFPNPTDGLFYFNYLLDARAEATAYLYDTRGRLIRKRKMKTGVVSQGWDLREFPGGVYFLVVKSAFGSDRGRGRVLYREKVVVY